VKAIRIKIKKGMNQMENLPGYIELIYLLPVLISLIYLLLQVLLDKKRVKLGMETLFEDKEQVISCTLYCFLPVFNIYMAFMGIKVIIKSLIMNIKY